MSGDVRGDSENGPGFRAGDHDVAQPPAGRVVPEVALRHIVTGVLPFCVAMYVAAAAMRFWIQLIALCVIGFLGVALLKVLLEGDWRERAAHDRTTQREYRTAWAVAIVLPLLALSAGLVMRPAQPSREDPHQAVCEVEVKALMQSDGYTRSEAEAVNREADPTCR